MPALSLAGAIVAGASVPVGIRRAGVVHLGQALGNRAITALVEAGRRRVQREEGGPADIAAQEAFNPMARMHQLLDAIDQSDTYMAGGTVVNPVLKRKVKFAAVVHALSDLTAEQARIVKAAYKTHENNRFMALESDLLSDGESGHPSDLNESQRAQIRALLAGTKADGSATEQEQQAAATNLAMAKAAEVQRLLKGKPSKANVEQVMAILRQPKEANTALNEAYKRLGGLLYVDLERTGQSRRAELLMEGYTVQADAQKVSGAQRRLEEINAALKAAEARSASGDLSIIESAENEVKARSLRAEQKKLIGEIEATGQQTITEAHAQPGATEADVHARVSAVYGDLAGLKGAVGVKSAPVLQAIVDNEPAMRIAAELRRSAAEGKLNGVQLTAALRRLRAEAEEQARRVVPEGDPGVDAKADSIAAEYFREVKTTYDELTKDDPKRKSFDELVAQTGNADDATLNKELVAGSGHIADARELVLALRGGRRDMATVERVLRNKDALTIKILKSQYTVLTMGRSLDYDLFGKSATKVGEQDFSGAPEGLVPAELKGKASGTARLNLEDYMQRPDREGGPEEVRYILARAEREYEYTIEHGGITGSINDAWGNEPRKLLDESIREIRFLVLQYRRLVGWDPESNTVDYPDELKSPKAQAIIDRMRLWRHTIRGDRAAYEEATAKLRATFEQVASFVLQAVLSAVLTPAAAALFRVAKGAQALTLAARVRQYAATVTAGTAANIGTTVAVTGDYSVAQLKNALVSNLAGPLGAGGMSKLGTELLASKMLGPVAKGLVERLGPKASAELQGFVKNLAASEASAAAIGESLTANLTIQNFLMDRAGELIGAATTKAAGLEGPAPGGETKTPPPAGGEPAGATGPAATPGTATTSPAMEHAPAGPRAVTPEATTLPVPTPVAAGAATATPTAPRQVPAGGEAAPTTEAPPSAGAAAGGKPPTAEGTGGGGGRPGGRPGGVGGGGSGGAGPASAAKPQFHGYEHNAERAAEVVAAQAGNRNVVVIDDRAELETRARGLGLVLDPRAKLWYEHHPNPNGGFDVVIVVDGTKVKAARPEMPPPSPTYPAQIRSPREAADLLAAKTAAGGENMSVLKTRDDVVEAWRQWDGHSDPPLAWIDTNNGHVVVDGTRVKPSTEGRVPGPSAGGPPTGDEGGGLGAPRVEAMQRPREAGTPPAATVPEPSTAAVGNGGEPPTPSPEHIRAIEVLNEEIRRLIGGEGIAAPPEGGPGWRPEMERSNAEVEAARQILADPNATPDNQLMAIRTLAERMVADYRTMRSAQRSYGEGGPSSTRLDAAALKDCCGAGRDITAESLITLLGNSPEPVIIERMQVEHIGLAHERHGFTVVSLPDGKAILVDPTFAQFGTDAAGRVTGEQMLGSTVARDLLRDGWVPLTRETAREYVIALGAKGSAIQESVNAILAGDGVVLTEVVQNGQVSRSADRPAEAYHHLYTVHGEYPTHTEIRDLLIDMPETDRRRPLLESLAQRLEQLAQSMQPLEAVPEPPEWMDLSNVQETPSSGPGSAAEDPWRE